MFVVVVKMSSLDSLWFVGCIVYIDIDSLSYHFGFSPGLSLKSEPSLQNERRR